MSVHLEKKVKVALDANERLGVIKKVSYNKPQLWCAPIHIVALYQFTQMTTVVFVYMWHRKLKYHITLVELSEHMLVPNLC